MSDYLRIRNMFAVAILSILSLGLSQCNKSPGAHLKDASETPSRFLYVSHTRLQDNSGIHPKVYQLDFSDYEYLLLGGDMAQKSFENEEIINHLDSVFSIGSSKTLWSVGNHDRVNVASFVKYTNKHKYGVYQSDDVSFVVLDSQDSLSSIVGKQKDFLFQTLDTISSNKLIFMTHKLIFMDQHPEMDKEINKVCNGKKGDCYYCHNTNNFQSEIYPRLKKLRKKGKQIMWIGGDLGKKASKYQFTTEEGIVFLGNGMDPDKEKNYVLIIENNDMLTFNFIDLDSLIQRTKQRE